MGYHVAVIRTGPGASPITPDEISSVIKDRLGYELDRDTSGKITQMSRTISDEEVLIFFDGSELWATNPSETVLAAMIDIAAALGKGARVRGDEGETYKDIATTYTHPDDASDIAASPKYDWKDIVSRAIPIVVALAGIYVLGKYLLRYLRG